MYMEAGLNCQVTNHGQPPGLTSNFFFVFLKRPYNLHQPRSYGAIGTVITINVGPFLSWWSSPWNTATKEKIVIYGKRD